MSTIPKCAAHPAADALPKMSDTEYQQLKEDIRANGLREAIVLHEGRILDGRHRYRACVELGIEPGFRDHDGSDPVAVVISMNLCRRHLDISQRALIAAELADMKRGGDRSKARNHALTHAAAAKLLNIGESSVDTASTLRNGVEAGSVDPELLALVEKGELSVSKAARVARLPKDQQLEAAAQKGRLKTVAGTLRRKPLARLVEEAERQSQEFCDTMEQVAWRANNAAAKLAPERYQQLVEVLNRHKERIAMQFSWLEEARDRSSMPLGTDSSAA
jgi:ParB-like chromosome segregation protein Spo0J